MSPISCDDVFDVLTRGPFPTGEPGDAAVEHHLINCHSCRRLAQALQPDAALFHESLSPDDCRDLPGYSGRLAVARSRHSGVALKAAACAHLLPPPRRLLRKSVSDGNHAGLLRCLLPFAIGAGLVIVASIIDSFLPAASLETSAEQNQNAAATLEPLP